MKVVILAGGFGTRISEESDFKPKPMITIGGKPILWHILKYYSSFEINEFIICCGYKGEQIKDFFYNYQLHNSDVTFDLLSNKMTIHKKKIEDWKISLIDTGENIETGGRLKRISNYIEDGEDFCMTYGDGLSNVDLKSLVRYHKSHNKLVTLTAVAPPARFGILELDRNNKVKNFYEKPEDTNLINGGFFVLSKKALDYINDDVTIWEKETLKILADKSELMAYKHSDFWQPMDTLRDQRHLNNLWLNNEAPWKIW